MNKGLPNIPTISASKLKVYKTCSKQYFYKYVLHNNDRPADDKNVAALLGTALHKAIESKYKENKSPTGVFQQVMNDTFNEWVDARYKINGSDYLARALKVGRDILTDFDWNKFNPQELEFSFTLPFPNPKRPIVNVTGVIDLIDMSGMVVDHKSASYAPNQDALDNDPQFILYYWAYEQMHGAAPWKVIWNHLRTAKFYEANIANNYEDKIEQLTADILAMTEAKRFARRQMDDECRKRCSFFDLCFGIKKEAELEI